MKRVQEKKPLAIQLFASIFQHRKFLLQKLITYLLSYTQSLMGKIRLKCILYHTHNVFSVKPTWIRFSPLKNRDSSLDSRYMEEFGYFIHFLRASFFLTFFINFFFFPRPLIFKKKVEKFVEHGSNYHDDIGNSYAETIFMSN